MNQGKDNRENEKEGTANCCGTVRGLGTVANRQCTLR